MLTGLVVHPTKADLSLRHLAGLNFSYFITCSKLSDIFHPTRWLWCSLLLPFYISLASSWLRSCCSTVWTAAVRTAGGKCVGLKKNILNYDLAALPLDYGLYRKAQSLSGHRESYACSLYDPIRIEKFHQSNIAQLIANLKYQWT